MDLRRSVIMATGNSELWNQWNYDEMDKLKYSQDKNFSLDSEMEVQGICPQNETSHPNRCEKLRKKSRSFDLGFFRSWRREFFPRHIQQQTRKKLTRQCRSLEGVILEEETVLDNSLSVQKLQQREKNLDLFELPSALKQLGRSLRAKR